jgi:two-component system NtrC family response regulator
MTDEVQKTRVLVVDDDDDVRSQMKWALAKDYEVFLAEDRGQALEILRKEKPTLVTLDLGLPPSAGDTKEGFRALSEMLEQDWKLKIIVVTGQNELEHGGEAIALGAYDFFSKPVDVAELKIVLGRARYVHRLEQARSVDAEVPDAETFGGIIGQSEEIRRVFQTVTKVARTDASVLIMGETGTGKELVARAIHDRSTRKSNPFVAINCGAIPETLLESELFGHEKGSFTGAHVQRKGRIEAAEGGTIFLDEIGELPGTLQVKLLRFLQEHEVERIGGRTPLRVDARVIAATNADLTKAMSEGAFREDLYYRLSVVVISTPPLRDRDADIRLLAAAFVEREAAAQQQKLILTPQAIQAVESYKWPGNVRELENRVRRAAIMAENGRITPADLELPEVGDFGGHGLGRARQELERKMIEAALARNNGNLTRAAQDLEISRPSLYELIDKLGIERR